MTCTANLSAATVVSSFPPHYRSLPTGLVTPPLRLPFASDCALIDSAVRSLTASPLVGFFGSLRRHWVMSFALPTHVMDGGAGGVDLQYNPPNPESSSFGDTNDGQSGFHSGDGHGDGKDFAGRERADSVAIGTGSLYTDRNRSASNTSRNSFGSNAPSSMPAASFFQVWNCMPCTCSARFSQFCRFAASWNGAELAGAVGGRIGSVGGVAAVAGIRGCRSGGGRSDDGVGFSQRNATFGTGQFQCWCWA